MPTHKPNFCNACPLSPHTKGYVPLQMGSNNLLFVGEAAGEDEADQGKPFVGGAGSWLTSLCKSAKLDRENASLVNTIGCQPKFNIYPSDQKWGFTSREDAQRGLDYCRSHHFIPSLKRWIASKPKGKIYALGNYALRNLTKREGITQWRGSVLPLLEELGGNERYPQVMPTLHPAYLMRQASLASVVISDLKKGFTVPPEKYNLFPTLSDVKNFKSKIFSFDFEWNEKGEISVCGLSDRFFTAMVVTFEEPYTWELKRIFEEATDIIGHNIINADMSYFEKLGWCLRDDIRIHDTMLKQHLIQPDYKHDLGFVSSVFTNKVFWKGKGWEEDDDGEVIGRQEWKSWDKEWGIPWEVGGYKGCKTAHQAFHLYNARDTDVEFQINTPLDHALTKYKLDSVYWNVSVPVAYICREMGERGVRLDTSRLGEIREAIDHEITQLENQLPVGLRPFEREVGCNIEAPEGTWKVKVKKCQGTVKGGKKHEPVDITFTEPSDIPCPTCGRLISSGKMLAAKVIKGTRFERVVPYNSNKQIQTYTTALNLKEVRDHKTGNVTTGKKARKIWAKDHPEFTVLSGLKQRVTLRNNFAKDTILSEERMFFNLKVHGTAEGRLSSTGRRKGVDLNIQNQPEKFRIIYVPDFPDWAFINLDIVQGENMLTTWLAKDWDRWERLNQPGYDEHADLASRIFNRPVSKLLAKTDPYINDLRQIGKKINHGRNYGMGVKKQLEELITMGFESYKESDVKEFIEIWKSMNPGTCRWQVETIAIATRDGCLTNPFGRKRWFNSRDVATKALAFLPASTLADMVLRMMVAHYPDRVYCQGPLSNLKLDVAIEIIKNWIMSIQVHDSLVLQGPKEGWREQAERSKLIMSQPWKELEGFKFSVEVKMSEKSWGDIKTVEV